MNSMKDFRGEELVLGDQVAYARRQGSSLWLEQGRVLFGNGLYDGKLRVENSRTGNTVCITRLEHVIKLAPATVPFKGQTRRQSKASW